MSPIEKRINTVRNYVAEAGINFRIDNDGDRIISMTELDRLGKLVVEARDKETPLFPIMKWLDKDLKIGAITFHKGVDLWTCGRCNEYIIYKDKYCRHCGQRNDWSR